MGSETPHAPPRVHEVIPATIAKKIVNQYMTTQADDTENTENLEYCGRSYPDAWQKSTIGREI